MLRLVRHLDTSAVLRIALASVLLLGGCGTSESDTPEGSGSTHWLRCMTPADCEGHPEATCSQGYCLDEDGMRIAVDATDTDDSAASDSSTDIAETTTAADSNDSTDGSTDEGSTTTSPDATGTDVDTTDSMDVPPTPAGDASAAPDVADAGTSDAVDPDSTETTLDGGTDEQTPDSGVDLMTAGECPAGPPRAGSVCSPEGLRCEYAGSPVGSTSTCSGGTWMEEFADSGDPCPPTVPTTRSACPAPLSPAASMVCLYDCNGVGACSGSETCGAFQGQCTETADGWQWNVTPLTQCPDAGLEGRACGEETCGVAQLCVAYESITGPLSEVSYGCRDNPCLDPLSCTCAGSLCEASAGCSVPEDGDADVFCADVNSQ